MNNQSRPFFFSAAIALFIAMLPPSLAEAAPTDHGDDQVTIFSDNTVPADDSISGDAVAIFGHLTVNGEVMGDTVAVMGRATINGTVHGKAVVVMGNLTLGPDAVVEGDVVCVAGSLRRSPGSRVGGGVIHQDFGADFHAVPALRTAFFDGIHSRRVWLASLLILSFYALVALVFPRGIRQCGDTLVERPGLSILAAILTLLSLPVLFILLFVTIVGIPVAIVVLPLGVIGLMMFGKASFYGLVGRAISRDGLPAAAAVFVGGLICLLFFMIPVVGILLSLLLSVLMLGCGVVALFASVKKPIPPPPAGLTAGRAAQAAMPAEASAKAEGPAYSSSAATGPTGINSECNPSPLEAAAVPPFIAPAAPPPPAPTPTPLPAPSAIEMATLRRAGFGIRTLALLIDFVLVVGVFHVFGGFVFILLGAYGAIMWKIRGTTVGGIICGLTVVRLDGRPIDWSTAIARGAGCFLSMIALGVGFIWVAFDDQRQSWHDKIAGTTVVHAPKGASLV